MLSAVFHRTKRTKKCKLGVHYVPYLILDPEGNLKVQHDADEPCFDIKDSQLRIFPHLDLNVRLALQNRNLDDETR